MLRLTEIHFSQLADHAQRCYPEECCGLLLGQNKVVQQVWVTENSWTPEFLAGLPVLSPYHLDQSRRNRFAIAPVDILAAQKYARQHALEIIGIYHSHPDYPAVPSEYDRAIAWDVYSYVILSIQQDQVATVRSWILDGDRQFQEEIIQQIKA